MLGGVNLWKTMCKNITDRQMHADDNIIHCQKGAGIVKMHLPLGSNTVQYCLLDLNLAIFFSKQFKI